jgi:hypothetical protein
LTPTSASNTLSCERKKPQQIKKSLDEDHGIYRDHSTERCVVTVGTTTLPRSIVSCRRGSGPDDRNDADKRKKTARCRCGSSSFPANAPSQCRHRHRTEWLGLRQLDPAARPNARSGERCSELMASPARMPALAAGLPDCGSATSAPSAFFKLFRTTRSCRFNLIGCVSIA